MTGETNDLAILRNTTSKLLLAVLWIHVPLSLVIGLSRGDWMMPTMMMAALAATATLSWRSTRDSLSTQLTVAIALMGGVSVLVYQMS